MKFSIIIVTRNRQEDVRDTIAGYSRQTYPDKEIIIIDNGSDDGTKEMMKNEFPEIKYLWLPDNFDIRAINIGIEMSDGEIIWRTDSDSYPESEDAFEKVAELFQKYDDIDIISTEDVEVRNNYAIWEWYPLKVDKSNIPEKGFKAHAFPGTGAAIRRRVYDKIGGFWGFGFEEIEFCTRAIVAGFNVRYFPNIRTLHFSSPRDRDNSSRFVKISTQYIRYVWRYFPFARALWRTGIFGLTQLLNAILSRIKPSAFFETYFSMAAAMFGTWRSERNVVPKEKLKDITLGVGIVSIQAKYFGEVVKKKLKKFSKK